MEQQKKDKILALVTTIVLHIVVLFVLWLTFLGKEPIGTGSGVLVQVGFVDESAGMFESNADRPEQTEAERPRENEDELLTQTDEESIHIEKKEEKKEYEKRKLYNPNSIFVLKILSNLSIYVLTPNDSRLF